MSVIREFFEKYINEIYLPELRIVDVLEILIVAFIIYEIILWIKNTKAWMLLRGMVVIAVFLLIALVFHMYTILFLAKASINVLAIAAVVVFQPEIRRALEKIGEKNFLNNISILGKNTENQRFTEETLTDIVKACFDMGGVKTGALIVVEQATRLLEYEKTGIALDCLVSAEVILNIFEHNTPLHDGAIIVRGNRIVSATCYLPLSDNLQISKDLGTRHRAALGMSEVSDALIIVVSEESGQVSVAFGGHLLRDVTEESLTKQLRQIQYKSPETGTTGKWKGWLKHEEN